jgi:hypothetical protein
LPFFTARDTKSCAVKLDELSSSFLASLTVKIKALICGVKPLDSGTLPMNLYEVLEAPLPVELGFGTAVTLALLKGLVTAFAGTLFAEVDVDVAVCISFSFLLVNKF